MVSSIDFRLFQRLKMDLSVSTCEVFAILSHYGLKMYHKTLANYYREHGIDMKFGRPQQRHLVHKEGRKEDIAGSAKELLRLLA